MKKSVETFTAFLDIMQGDPIYANASRALGLHETTVYRWIKESKRAAEHPEEASEYLLEYAGETKYFHQHMRDCITSSVDRIEQAARSRAENGHYSVSMFQGRTVWRTDPSLMNLDDETLAILGYPDRLLRDANGQSVPELVWHAPSTDLVQMILQAHSKKYRRQSSVQVDVNNRHSGGVLVIGSTPKIAASATPTPLPLEVLGDAIEPERPLRDELEPMAEDADEDQHEPAPVRRGTGNPLVRRGTGSELEKDLLARLQARAGTPDRVAPVSRVSPRDSDDYNPNRTGPGTPPGGGGMKVV